MWSQQTILISVRALHIFTLLLKDTKRRLQLMRFVKRYNPVDPNLQSRNWTSRFHLCWFLSGYHIRRTWFLIHIYTFRYWFISFITLFCLFFFKKVSFLKDRIDSHPFICFFSWYCKDFSRKRHYKIPGTWLEMQIIQADVKIYINNKLEKFVRI